MIEARNGAAAVRVVTLRETFDVLRVIEIFQGETERIFHADGFPEAAGCTSGRALSAHAERAVIFGGDVKFTGRADAITKKSQCGRRAFANYERVMQILLESAEVDGVVVFVGDEQAENAVVKSARRFQVSDDEVRVGSAKNVRRLRARTLVGQFRHTLPKNEATPPALAC